MRPAVNFFFFFFFKKRDLESGMSFPYLMGHRGLGKMGRKFGVIIYHKVRYPSQVSFHNHGVGIEAKRAPFFEFPEGLK
jgi:hypothetical protein